MEWHARREGCFFCLLLGTAAVVAENDFAFALYDKYPVRPLHTLVLPKRHITDVFFSTAQEREAMHELILSCRETILREDATVLGFNLGSNIGHAAGQKIFHAHVHLIPRRDGEAELPGATSG